MKAGNIETFFNLIQLAGKNPLVLQAVKFYLEKDQIIGFDSELAGFFTVPFQPGTLYERLLTLYPQPEEALDHFFRLLSEDQKLAEAGHWGGVWIDNWCYYI